MDEKKENFEKDNSNPKIVNSQIDKKNRDGSKKEDTSESKEDSDDLVLKQPLTKEQLEISASQSSPSLEKIVERESVSPKEENSKKQDNEERDFFVGYSSNKEQSREYGTLKLDIRPVGNFSTNQKNLNSLNKRNSSVSEADLRENYLLRKDYQPESHSEEEILLTGNLDDLKNFQDKYRKFKFR